MKTLIIFTELCCPIVFILCFVILGDTVPFVSEINAMVFTIKYRYSMLGSVCERMVYEVATLFYVCRHLIS